ncbi:MAG: FecR domain-containing protein [Myxococcaceae bacterium]|nr:FecR domain-containing protein [Myxococcaceae bacterium]
MGVVAAAWLLFDRFVRERPDRPAPPVTIVPAPSPEPAKDAGRPAPVVTQARVVSVKGDVRRSFDPDRLHPSDRAWTPVKVGELLGQNERLRTAGGGTAELAVGEASSIVVSEATEVGVIELSEAVQRFKLVRGRVTADSAPGGRRTLRIEGENGQTASTEGGRFSVLATARTFTVASERGQVNLASAGKVVTVGAGEQAFVPGNLAPSAPSKIPVEVLLLAAGRRGSCEEIHGTAAVGSEVRVGDRLAMVDERGRFAIQLEPVRGRKSVTVRTRDAAGHVVERVVKCAPRGRKSEVDDIAIKRWHKRSK